MSTVQVALVAAVSILLNVPRFFRIDIVASSANNATTASPYGFSYTPLAHNFFFKVHKTILSTLSVFCQSASSLKYYYFALLLPSVL